MLVDAFRGIPHRLPAGICGSIVGFLRLPYNRRSTYLVAGAMRRRENGLAEKVHDR